jgi:DNA topoisomerase II
MPPKKIKLSEPVPVENDDDGSLSKQYVHLSDREHVLLRPDMYLGSIKETEEFMWILIEGEHNNKKSDESEDSTSKPHIIRKQIKFVPGLFKIFDEALVNCRDHYIKMETLKKTVNETELVTEISVSIDENNGTFTFFNDGNGIDVEMHDKLGIYIPQAVFAVMRTSTNFSGPNQNGKTGSINGFGIKLAIVMSEYAKVETFDAKRGLLYTQIFHNNLEIVEPPIIKSKKTGKAYTQVTFRPDYKRMGLSSTNPLSEDVLGLFKRRVYDLAMLCSKNVKVKLNNRLISTRTFQHYVQLHEGIEKDTTVFENVDENWSYAICESPLGVFSSVSFVNGINVYKGGKHVDYISNQVVGGLIKILEKKKKNLNLSPAKIKSNLMLFLSCNINFPTFDSQCKETLNTNITNFGSTCKVSEDFIEKVYKKLKIVDSATETSNLIDSKSAKKTDGSKSRRIPGEPITKLSDANFAGTAQSNECVLIICEGDSAKTGVLSGLSPSDRNIYGIYAARGKFINVRNHSIKDINDNSEISELKRILGLEHNRKYTSIADVHKYLRYSKILIMTDQDYDGSHIKGLLLNIFDSQWKELLDIPGFIGFFNTPLLKATKTSGKKKETLSFYNIGEYKKWVLDNNNNTASGDNDVSVENLKPPSGWEIKYYKGLGTSTPKEFIEYMKDKKIVDFIKTPASDDKMDMIFNAKRADERKTWLHQYNRKLFVDTSKKSVTIEEFIDKELIHFSKYDCERSISNVLDGMKPSQRKILYACFKRKLSKEIKVAQLSGYVSEHTEYHHGEASLQGAIISMAQTFVGSNNIEVLEPLGQFGSRLQGGKDAASPRYIFTRLNPLTRMIFPESDDALLTYLMEDGKNIEPVYYVPIIPMILVNGSDGIGTGTSSFIPCFNPIDLIDFLLQKIRPSTEIIDSKKLFPYYRGFKGSITKIGPHRYMSRGIYKKLGPNTIEVTELPIRCWTQKLKDRLEELMNQKTKTPDERVIINSYTENHTDSTANFKIEFNPGFLDQYEKQMGDHNVDGVEKLLNLTSTFTTSNMYLFDKDEHLVKYDSAEEIVDAFFPVRKELYHQRKEKMLAKLLEELCLLNNKSRYINALLDGSIDLRRKTNQMIVTLLTELKFDDIDEDGFKYLIKLPMDVVSEEYTTKIEKELNDKKQEYTVLQNKQPEDIWEEELNELKKSILESTTITETTEIVDETVEAEAETTKPRKGPVKKTVAKTLKNKETPTPTPTPKPKGKGKANVNSNP